MQQVSDKLITELTDALIYLVGVGKSSLLLRFAENVFSGKCFVTLKPICWCVCV